MGGNEAVICLLGSPSSHIIVSFSSSPFISAFFIKRHKTKVLYKILEHNQHLKETIGKGYLIINQSSIIILKLSQKGMYYIPYHWARSTAVGFSCTHTFGTNMIGRFRFMLCTLNYKIKMKLFFFVNRPIDVSNAWTQSMQGIQFLSYHVRVDNQYSLYTQYK